MVSQEFMNILLKQPNHNTPTTSSSVASSGNGGRSLNVQENECKMIKKEKEDYDDFDQSAVEMVTVHTGLIIKKEEDCSNDWKPSLTQTMVSSESSSKASPLHQTFEGNKEPISFYSPESPQQLERKEKALLGRSNKRIIKKKRIYDPSDISSLSQKDHMKKASHKAMKKVLGNSETHEHHMKTPKLLIKVTSDKSTVSSTQSKNCKYCGKCVKRKDYMRLHLMKHTGETPYKCPHCTNAYRTRWRLTQHIRTHSKNLPYHCPYCNYCGNRSDYLSSHVRRVHHKELQQSLQQEKNKKEIKMIKKEKFEH